MGSTVLTTNRKDRNMSIRDTYQALKANSEGGTNTDVDTGKKWRIVYLPNAKSDLKNITAKQFAGFLSALAEHGAYRPCEWDRQYFGEVCINA